MLFDPKWKQKTVVTPLSLAGFIAWLETQPPATEYEWMNCAGGCLFDQYGASIGHEHIAADWGSIKQVFGPPGNYSRICGKAPYTFGAALTRARAVLAAH